MYVYFWFRGIDEFGTQCNNPNHVRYYTVYPIISHERVQGRHGLRDVAWVGSETRSRKASLAQTYAVASIGSSIKIWYAGPCVNLEMVKHL